MIGGYPKVVQTYLETENLSKNIFKEESGKGSKKMIHEGRS